MTSLAVVVAALATWSATAPASPVRAARRTTRLVAPGPVRRRHDPARLAGPGAQGRVVTAALAGGAVVLLVGAAGLVLAPLVAVAVWVVVGRLEPADVRRRRNAVLHALPGAADLLVACVSAGATPRDSLAAAGEATDGPLGEVLRDAARAQALGATTAEVQRTWEQDDALAPLLPVGVALARSEHDGAPLARTLRHVADDLRADRAHRVAAAARRAGVQAAAPLGLCFLPAFVLVGLAPVVLAIVAR